MTSVTSSCAGAHSRHCTLPFSRRSAPWEPCFVVTADLVCVNCVVTCVQSSSATIARLEPVIKRSPRFAQVPVAVDSMGVCIESEHPGGVHALGFATLCLAPLQCRVWQCRHPSVNPVARHGFGHPAARRGRANRANGGRTSRERGWRLPPACPAPQRDGLPRESHRGDSQPS